MPPEFFQTVMGRAFYEHTVPKIAATLERIATTLEQLNRFMQEKEAMQEAEKTEYNLTNSLTYDKILLSKMPQGGKQDGQEGSREDEGHGSHPSQTGDRKSPTS